MENTITVKDEIDFGEFKDVHPSLIIVLGYYSLFCHENKINCKISSIKEEVVTQRQTKTHSSGRAFDSSIKQFSTGQIMKCILYMEKHVGHLGAYSYSDKKQRVIVFHDVGRGKHFHFQVHP